MKFLPGAPDEFFVLRKLGAVYHYKLDGEASNSATLVRAFNVPMVRPPSNGSDTGLLSLAFDPGFATNKFVYFGYAVAGGGRTSAITRFTYENGAITNPQRIIEFTTDTRRRRSTTRSVRSGSTRTGTCGALHGDWNIANTPARDLELAARQADPHRPQPQRRRRWLGTGARATPTWRIPKPKSAVYAYGFRSPGVGPWTPAGRYIVGDIGPNAGEEVNVVTRGGQDLGWNGNATCGAGSIFCYRGGIAMLQGPGDSLNGRSVWVGPQYGDCGNDRYNGTLTGVYFNGDFFTGWVVGRVMLNEAGARRRYKQLGTCRPCPPGTRPRTAICTSPGSAPTRTRARRRRNRASTG